MYIYIYICGSSSRLKRQEAQAGLWSGTSSTSLNPRGVARQSSLSAERLLPGGHGMVYAAGISNVHPHRFHNWIWCDKVQQGFTCRRCGTEWQRPQQGFALKTPQAKTASRWQRPRYDRPAPPPELGRQRSPKPSRLQKSASEILAPAWGSLDEQLRAKLTESGHCTGGQACGA